ncbi:hypothetical protein FSP39_003178, partial [Pinctada imbricata]
RRTAEKTPSTLLKMMERHRESERVRHHTLNELMRNVCEGVPGYSDVSKETKSCDVISTSDNLDTFPDPFDLMSSPVGKRHFGMLSPKMDGLYASPCGIKSDQRDLNETLELGENEMKTVSPECILQTNLGSQDDYISGSCSKTLNDLVSKTGHSNSHSTPGKTSVSTPGRILSNTPVKSPVIIGKNKRKQYTPMRSPFHDVTNYMNSPENDELYGPISFDEPKPKRMRLDNDLMPGKFARESPLDEDFVSYVPYIWKFHSAKFTKRQKAEPPTCLPVSPGKENSNGPDSLLSKPEKVDHRKTTWMNGFMMFSRLNRRSFISANPGVHTSQISKMMGHTWRNMSAEEQLPYKFVKFTFH